MPSQAESRLLGWAAQCPAKSPYRVQSLSRVPLVKREDVLEPFVLPRGVAQQLVLFRHTTLLDGSGSARGVAPHTRTGRRFVRINPWSESP